MSFIIGLTGGIGSGKSAVSDYLANKGIDVVDADVIAHALTAAGSPMLKALADAFGDWVIDDAGNYARKRMREFVFAHPDALAKLDAITHPAINAAIRAALADSHTPYTLLSVPLLFENRHNTPSLLDLCQHTLVVDVPMSVQIARASARDDDARIRAIIDKQISRADRLAIADHIGATIIDNTADLPTLHATLDTLHEQLLSLATGSNNI